MPPSDDELRDLVKEAARAARAAQESAERAAREAPSFWEKMIETLTRLLGTFFDGILASLQREWDHARRAGEDFLARAILALSRTLEHILAAFIWLMVGLTLLAAALVVLAIGLVVWLNERLGDPVGTMVAGLLFLAAGAGALFLARGRLRAVGREATTLSPRVR